MLLADTAADDEQVGREKSLHQAKILINSCCPPLPTEFLFLADAIGCVVLSLHNAARAAYHGHVTQLGIGHKRSVDENSTADTGAEGEHEDHPLAASPCSEGHLGNAGSIGVVDKQHRAANLLLQELAAVGANPGVVHVGCGVDDTLLDHRWEGAANVTFPAEVLDDLGHRVGDGARCRRLRSGDAVELCRQHPPLDFHRRSLDAGSANVDSQDLHMLLLTASRDVTTLSRIPEWPHLGRRGRHQRPGRG